MTNSDKHSSLLWHILDYRHEIFYTTDPMVEKDMCNLGHKY
jgi:hypothetical protein